MPPSNDRKALEELLAYETGDEVLQRNLASTWEILERSKPAKSIRFNLLNGRLALASPNLRKSRYATANCMALLDERLIIVDEDFLLEIEAAIRAFESADRLEACPCVRSDEDLFGLTDRISADPQKFLHRMRRLTTLAPERESAVLETIALTYLFFIGHELGHLANGKDERNFTTFVNPEAPFEHKLANAVVKLRRHAEEFAHFGFNLRDFEDALRKGSEIERTSAALQRQLDTLYLNHNRWFQDEVIADDAGLDIVRDYLSALSGEDRANACMVRAVRGIFAAALYAWYQDLRIFCTALGTGWLTNSRDLTLAMMRDRRHYIRAAALFGDVHRFTLLRGERFIEALIKTRSSIFGGGENAGSPGADSLSGDQLTQVLERYYLLCIMMDTAVKIAYLGASTAWMLEKDTARGTSQLFMMYFESIASAMGRLKKLMSGAKP